MECQRFFQEVIFANYGTITARQESHILLEIQLKSYHSRSQKLATTKCKFKSHAMKIPPSLRQQKSLVFSLPHHRAIHQACDLSHRRANHQACDLPRHHRLYDLLLRLLHGHLSDLPRHHRLYDLLLRLLHGHLSDQTHFQMTEVSAL